MLRPPCTDKAISAYIDHLEAKIKVFETSPYAKTYLTFINQINDFNQQLIILDPVTEHLENGKSITTIPGRIDLFGEGKDKDFDRSAKFFDKVSEWLDIADKFRSKMTASERKEIESKVVKKEGVEEFLKENARGSKF